MLSQIPHTSIDISQSSLSDFYFHLGYETHLVE